VDSALEIGFTIAQEICMARKTQIFSTEFPYHVSARSVNRDWFFTPLVNVWKIMEEQLFFLHHAFGFRIHSFVLMANHFHLLVTTPQGNLSEGMNYFMRESSRQIGFLSHRINQTYGARYSRSLIEHPNYYLHAYKYIYRNPVQAGICQRVEHYRFSTLHGLLGFGHLLIPLELDRNLLADPEKTLAWLNNAPSEEHRLVVKRAMRKSVYRYPNDRKRSRPHELVSGDY